MESYKTAKNIAEKYVRITETNMQACYGTLASMTRELQNIPEKDKALEEKVKTLTQTLNTGYASSINNASMRRIANEFIQGINYN